MTIDQESDEAPPILSTPNTHIFENVIPNPGISHNIRSDEEIYITYEIQRTVAEIRGARWKRIALQFPDMILPDAPKVYQALSKGLKEADPVREVFTRPSLSTPAEEYHSNQKQREDSTEEKLYILADTSYGACCVDEIAAEHINADGVVHYGRACLSPTARLPVVHVFTRQPLEADALLRAFEETFPDHEAKVILMADVIYSSHLPDLCATLVQRGYSRVFTTQVIHDPSSILPNRTVPDGIQSGDLRDWQLFHVSDPPESLLMILSSRVSNIYIFPTAPKSYQQKPLLASTARALSRRYALLTSVSTVSIFGILINTLSVKNYLHVVEHVKAQILAAGKKHYTFVVGKVNAAKVANFSEIGAWVVIGCWESSLIESKDFWRPIITPFELELALKRDDERIWTGEWRSDFQTILGGSMDGVSTDGCERDDAAAGGSTTSVSALDGNVEIDSEPESAPPEYDLRAGRYVSHSRPMQAISLQPPQASLSASGSTKFATSLIKRGKGELTVAGGEVSPGAEFLRSKRTWKGLGSDFEIAYDESPGAPIEEGRKGIARGYTHGEGMPIR